MSERDERTSPTNLRKRHPGMMVNNIDAKGIMCEDSDGGDGEDECVGEEGKDEGDGESGHG